MKYYTVEGVINEESFEKFLGFMNGLEDDSDATIILNSGGGKSNLASVILDIINHNKDRVTLISCGIYSAAFYIFYNAKCKKKMTTESVGMIHRSVSEMRLASNCNPVYFEDINTIKNWKESESDLEFVSQFMSSKELKVFKKGDDVYFTFKRMKEIFTDVEII